MTEPSETREIAPVDIAVRLRCIGIHRHVGWDLVDGVEVERERFEPNPTCLEAAREIERLRAALALSDAMFRAITAYEGDELAEVYPFLADNARLLERKP